MNVVAGLDLSLRSTGVAVITGDRTAEYFSFGYSLRADAGNYDTIKRYISITQGIVTTLKKFSPAYVAMENYGFATKKLAPQAELGGIVKSQIYLALKQVPLCLPSKAIRMVLLGHAKHDDIKGKVRRKLLEIGYPSMDNDDQSDALAVAHVVYSLHQGPRTAYERKVMDGLIEQKFRG